MLVAGCLMLDGGFGGVIGVNWGGNAEKSWVFCLHFSLD